MDIWVNTASKTEDYAWRTCVGCNQQFPPAFITNGYDQWKFEDCVPWFGLVSDHDSAVLFFGNLMTNMEDSRGRPIFVHAALRAADDRDVRELYGITAALLVHEKELLPKWSEYFLKAFADGKMATFPSYSQNAVISAPYESFGHFVYPRDDIASRERIAVMLTSAAESNVPLAVGTTGRSGKGIFERVCNSQAKWQTAFFSSTCSNKTELPVKEEPLAKEGLLSKGVPYTRIVAAAIGGAIILALIAAAIGPCSRERGHNLTEGGYNLTGVNAEGGTNIQHGTSLSVTNLQTQGTSNERSFD